MNRIGVFILLVAFIILVGDLPVKVAEDFAVIGAKIGGWIWEFRISKARRVSRGQSLVYRGGSLILSTKFP